MNADTIRRQILAALPGSTVEVHDTTGGGDHFEAQVVSPDFVGKTMIEQHRLVYGALGDAVGREIHALALRTFTPDEWASMGAGSRR